jgi:AcrR family transcriptional regulator
MLFEFEDERHAFEKESASENHMTAILESDAGDAAGGRLERRKARTRAAILSAASALFHERGYEETAIQQIAERADAGVGTLYGYFRSKEDILREVLKEHSIEAVQRYRAAIDESTPAIERLCTALDVLARYIRENRPILLAAFRLSGEETEGEPGGWIFRAYRQMLHEGMEAGELRTLPLETTVRSLLMVYMTALLGMGQFQGCEDDPRLVGELEIITRAMLRP